MFTVIPSATTIAARHFLVSDKHLYSLSDSHRCTHARAIMLIARLACNSASVSPSLPKRLRTFKCQHGYIASLAVTVPASACNKPTELATAVAVPASACSESTELATAVTVPASACNKSTELATAVTVLASACRKSTEHAIALFARLAATVSPRHADTGNSIRGL